MTTKLRFACPSCGTKFAAIEGSDSATQVVNRTCRNRECGERYQLIVKMLRDEGGVRMDKAELLFLDNAYTRRKKRVA